MKNSNSQKHSVEEKSISEIDNKHLLAECRKEIERLQILIAKKQVAHESEIYKLRAEHAEELAKVKANNVTVNILPVSAKDGRPI